ncbi:hypothetical protein MMC10_006165 [Thelotrema lepadinum]|nr:hypothetical protein [Thelotrema lepadinum]
MGMSMPGWYDISTFGDLTSKSDDEPGITRSRDYINNLISTETTETGVPTHRMILGGFSQGGALSLFTALTTPHPLAGFFGLSSYLLMGHKVASLAPAGNPNGNVPVFMGHGDADPLVRYAWGERTAEALRGMGRKVDFRTYKGLEHSADLREISDLEKFIAERLPEAEGEVAELAATEASSSSSKA